MNRIQSHFLPVLLFVLLLCSWSCRSRDSQSAVKEETKDETADGSNASYVVYEDGNRYGRLPDEEKKKEPCFALFRIGVVVRDGKVAGIIDGKNPVIFTNGDQLEIFQDKISTTKVTDYFSKVTILQNGHIKKVLLEWIPSKDRIGRLPQVTSGGGPTSYQFELKSGVKNGLVIFRIERGMSC